LTHDVGFQTLTRRFAPPSPGERVNELPGPTRKTETRGHKARGYEPVRAFTFGE